LSGPCVFAPERSFARRRQWLAAALERSPTSLLTLEKKLSMTALTRLSARNGCRSRERLVMAVFDERRAPP
jgi:hypothetical protein